MGAAVQGVERPGRGNGRFGSRQGAQGGSVTGIATRCHRTRQRTAVVGGRWTAQGSRPAPRIGALAFRHDSRRPVRRRPDGRRRFRSARRRGSFRRDAGTRRAARRPEQSHRPQERPPAACDRTQLRPPRLPHHHHDQDGRTRGPAGPPVRQGREQPRALGDGTVGENTGLQSAAHARQHGGRRNPGCRGGDRSGRDQCRSLVRHPRSPERDAASQARRPRADGRGDEQGARRRELHRLGAADLRARQHQSRQARLCLARCAARPLCRLRGAHHS